MVPLPAVNASRQLAIVVYLAVADDLDRAVFVRDRLVASPDVYDGEPPHAQEEVVVNEGTLVVGTTVDGDRRHPAEIVHRWPAARSKSEDSVDPAHG